MKVYVRTGDLNYVAERETFPDSEGLVDLFKEALANHGKDEVALGTLTCFSSRGCKGKTFWIASKSLVRKAGFKIEKGKRNESSKT